MIIFAVKTKIYRDMCFNELIANLIFLRLHYLDTLELLGMNLYFKILHNNFFVS